MIIKCNNVKSMKPSKKAAGPAFLLAQVGAHAASTFRERIAAIGLAPPDAGVFRLLAATQGISQQDLSSKLGIHPSRLVSILDELESRGLLERKPNAEDRRQYALHLTTRGRETFTTIAQISQQHQEELCASLTRDEREKLADLLRKIADQQGLTPGVHPGYRRLRPKP
jgi:DNA-binding MarR family transcriptional regulator